MKYWIRKRSNDWKWFLYDQVFKMSARKVFKCSSFGIFSTILVIWKKIRFEDVFWFVIKLDLYQLKSSIVYNSLIVLEKKIFFWVLDLLEAYSIIDIPEDNRLYPTLYFRTPLTDTNIFRLNRLFLVEWCPWRSI